MSWRKILKGAGVSFLVIVLTLLYWEFGLRLIGKTAFPLLRADPEVGSIMVANYSGYAWDLLSGRKNYIHTNSIGYVGDDVAREKPTTTIRIALLGDSGLAALQVNYYNNFSRLLEAALNASALCGGTHFEVMNFGVGSASTFSEYLTYEKKIAPYHPDHVVVMFDDDYGDNMQKSSFDLDHYSSERTAVGLKAFLLQFTLPKFLAKKLEGSATFVNLLRISGIREASGVTPMMPSATGTSTVGAQPANYFDYTFTLMRKFNDLVEGNGERFSVVIFPHETLDYGEKGAWKNNDHVTRMLDFLAKAGIPFLNPSDELADAHAQNGSCISFDCGTHFNEVGHQAMARILYSYVKHDLLKEGALCPKP